MIRGRELADLRKEEPQSPVPRLWSLRARRSEEIILMRNIRLLLLKVNAQRIETFPMLVISSGWPRKELRNSAIRNNTEVHCLHVLYVWWQGAGSRGQPQIPHGYHEEPRSRAGDTNHHLSSFRQAVGVTLLTESLRGKCRARICRLDFQQNDAGSITWVAAVGNSFWLRPWNIWSWAVDLREEKNMTTLLALSSAGG